MQLRLPGELASLLITLLAAGKPAPDGEAGLQAAEFRRILDRLLPSHLVSSGQGLEDLAMSKGEFEIRLFKEFGPKLETALREAMGQRSSGFDLPVGADRISAIKSLKAVLAKVTDLTSSSGIELSSVFAPLKAWLDQLASTSSTPGWELPEDLRVLHQQIQSALADGGKQIQDHSEAEPSLSLQWLRALAQWMARHDSTDLAEGAADESTGRVIEARTIRTEQLAEEDRYVPPLAEATSPLPDPSALDELASTLDPSLSISAPAIFSHQGKSEQPTGSAQATLPLTPAKGQIETASPWLSPPEEAGPAEKTPSLDGVALTTRMGPTPEPFVDSGSPQPDQLRQVKSDLTGYDGLSWLSSSVTGRTILSSEGEAKAQHAVFAPLASPHWAEEFGQRLIWLHGKSIQAAEIHLNPPELGPVAVRIRLHEDQTSVQFASPHAAVREAIEAALPRLKEMFEARQLSLAQVEVAQQSLEDRSSYSQARQESHWLRDYPDAREKGKEESRSEYEGSQAHHGNRLLSLYV